MKKKKNLESFSPDKCSSFPQTTKRDARPTSNFKIVFQQMQNIQTQRYTSTQDNEDIKSKICERAPLGIRPSSMNAARRSTHNPRTQHQRCVPLHVRHGGPRTFWTETSWWNTMVFALCGKAHGPHMRKQVLNTSWVLYRGNKTTIRRVDSTQADKLRSSAREHAAHTTCGNLCYVNTWSLQKNTYAELIDGTAPNGNTNTTNRLNWIGAPNILTACTTCSASISAGN